MTNKQKEYDVMMMVRALDLAQKGQGKTAPNPMVGTLIVKGGKVVGQGWHRRCGGPHAEVLALRQAKRKARGATMYVTLEPCFHVGRTPPCVDAVIKSGVKNVVIAMKDPNSLTSGRSIRRLKTNGIAVRCGVMKNAAQKLNESFVKHITTGMPFVTAKIAQTLDGKTATANGKSQWITSEKTRTFARKRRDHFDAIMVGINTVLKDDPRLTLFSKKENFRRIIVDSSLRVPVKARLFRLAGKGKCIVATTAKASARKMKTLERKGVEVIICPQKGCKVDLEFLMKQLGERLITNILLEGGATLTGAMLKHKLVDKVHCYIAPTIMGDQKALSSVQGMAPQRIDHLIRMKQTRVFALEDDILIEGYI